MTTHASVRITGTGSELPPDVITTAESWKFATSRTVSALLNAALFSGLNGR